MTTISKIRPSPIAGRWYSDDPARLGAQMDELIHNARIPALEGEVVALIAPHAGHRYSGVTAGYAFRTVLGRPFDLVAVVSPLHQYYPATFLTSAHQAYGTPLGAVEIDQQAVADVDASLKEQGFPGLHPIAYDDEHSLEIELPFIQRALPGPFRLLPVMVRSQSPADAEALGHALAKALAGRQAVMIASSDLSHFYPEAVAGQLDGEMLRQIAGFSPEGAFKAEQTGQGFACGIAAIGAVLWAARDLGADRVEILHHSTSADQTGDFTSVVGYGAAVVLKGA